MARLVSGVMGRLVGPVAAGVLAVWLSWRQGLALRRTEVEARRLLDAYSDGVVQLAAGVGVSLGKHGRRLNVLEQGRFVQADLEFAGLAHVSDAEDATR